MRVTFASVYLADASLQSRNAVAVEQIPGLFSERKRRWQTILNGILAHRKTTTRKCVGLCLQSWKQGRGLFGRHVREGTVL